MEETGPWCKGWNCNIRCPSPARDWSWRDYWLVWGFIQLLPSGHVQRWRPRCHYSVPRARTHDLSGRKDCKRGPGHQIPPWPDHDPRPTFDELGLNRGQSTALWTVYHLRFCRGSFVIQYPKGSKRSKEALSKPGDWWTDTRHSFRSNLLGR